MPDILIEQLEVRRGDYCLAARDLVIPLPGTTWVFGENGSGKSTFLDVLAGRRRAAVLRVEPRPLRQSDLRSMSAYLSEGRFALDEFTLRQAVTIARVFFEGFATDAFSRDVEDAGLAMGRPLGSCSSGEQRMIDALLMLHSGRALIIIDEVFAHLDSKRASLTERAIAVASRTSSVVIATQELTVRQPSPAQCVTYQVKRQNGGASVCAF